MKRILVIPIMFLYLLAVSGVMIHVHYCGQALESWNVYTPASGCEDSDCEDEPGENDGCCKDKIIAGKISQDQHQSDLIKIKSAVCHPDCLRPSYEQPAGATLNSAEADKNTNQSNAPPGSWQSIPLYRLHSSLVYYG